MDTAWPFAIAPILYLAAVTVPLTLADAREHRLPNRLVLPGYPVAVAAALLAWPIAGASPALPLLAGAGYAAFLLLLSRAGGMGMGDVKLAGVLGLTLGMVSARSALLAPAAAFLLGGLAAAILLLGRRANRRSRMAFGPYLLAGFWLALGAEAVIA